MSKYYFILFTFFFLSNGIQAQIDHDECQNAIVLGEVPSCPEMVFSNVNATESNISTVPAFEIPSCWTEVGNDVWAAFTIPADGSYVDFQITVNGVPDGPNMQTMLQPRIALYRGECSVDGMVELACQQADLGSGSVQLDIEGLTPGEEYFLRMSTYSASATPNDGDFMVCVDTIPASVIEVIAEPATLCGPQEITQLTATSTGGDLAFYSWTPAEVLSDPNAANPFAFPFQTTTFTVTAYELATNLVENGDFESGNIGFTSEYSNVDGDLNGLCQGCYNINDITPSLWTQCAAIEGNMMVVNGSPEANVNLWCQEITVLPGAEYFFSFDVQTINSPVPELQLSVDGNLIGNSLFGSWTCNVVQFFETITVGANTTVEICIVNQSTSADGNDFALDNINFSTYTQQMDSVTVEVSNLTSAVTNIVADGCQAGCSGSAEVTANGGVGASTFEWPDGQTTAAVNGLCPGSYDVTVTDGVGCAVVQSINILPPQFSISVISLGNPCEASTIGSAQAIVSGGTEPYTYLWDNGETTEVAENLTAGTHSVTVTDAAGCEVIGEVEIVLLPNGFMVEVMADQDTLCPGQSVQLTAISEGAEEFLWNTEASGSMLTITPETTTYYEVTAKRLGDNIIENGDFSGGNTGFVSDYADAIGLGLGGTWGPLSLEGTYAVTNDPSAVHTNFIACGDHTSGTGNMLVVNGSGVPDLPAWCETVTVNPNLTYQFSAWLTSVVSDNPAVLQFSINGELIGNPFQAGFATCDWTNFFEIWESDGATSAEICIVNQNISVGGNDFALDDIALVPVCVATAGVTIQVSDLEAFTTNVEPVSCETNFGSAVALSINGEAPYTYAWSNGETTAEVNNFEAGTYSVTITDAFGCTAVATAVIEPGPFVVIDEVVVTDVTCGPVSLDNIVIIPGSAEVFPGAGDAPFSFSLDGGTTFQDSPLFENLDPGFYFATIKDANGCQAQMEFEVGDVDLPTVSIETDDEFNLCNGGSIDLWLETTGEIDSILWSINSMADTITLVESGLVSVTVVDDQGCAAVFEVEIDDCIDYRIPNVFTPNGDDYNDEFKVYTSGGVVVRRMQLFNRWGNLVHDSTEPWNGDYKGEPHQADVLIYIIVIDTGDGEVVEQGEVTLLR